MNQDGLVVQKDLTSTGEQLDPGFERVDMKHRIEQFEKWAFGSARKSFFAHLPHLDLEVSLGARALRAVAFPIRPVYVQDNFYLGRVPPVGLLPEAATFDRALGFKLGYFLFTSPFNRHLSPVVSYIFRFFLPNTSCAQPRGFTDLKIPPAPQWR